MTNSHSIKITMSSPEEIGKAIQKQRRAQKITQKEFAQHLGKSERTIQKYESGEILMKICPARWAKTRTHGSASR